MLPLLEIEPRAPNMLANALPQNYTTSPYRDHCLQVSLLAHTYTQRCCYGYILLSTWSPFSCSSSQPLHRVQGKDFTQLPIPDMIRRLQPAWGSPSDWLRDGHVTGARLVTVCPGALEKMHWPCWADSVCWLGSADAPARQKASPRAAGMGSQRLGLTSTQIIPLFLTPASQTLWVSGLLLYAFKICLWSLKNTFYVYVGVFLSQELCSPAALKCGTFLS